MQTREVTQLLKNEAIRLGFDRVGVATAEFMTDEAERLENWLNSGFHGKMGYMENHFDLRGWTQQSSYPVQNRSFPLAYNYHNPDQQADPEAPQISQYAYGEDYHKVLRRKLKALLRFLRENVGDVNGRCFVDSGPVLERKWARRAGIGWVGRNTMLIHPQKGSYYFLTELIIDLELEPDAPMRDHCGNCRACIDACPTGAIADNGYVMDGSKCISYLTIELRDAIPESFRGDMGRLGLRLRHLPGGMPVEQVFIKAQRACV